MPLSLQAKPEVVGRSTLTKVGVEVSSLSPKIQKYIEEQVKVCQPDSVHVCDGSEAENQALLSILEKAGRIKKLQEYDNW